MCSEVSEIIAGLSGKLTFSGGESNGFSVNVAALDPLLPGQGVLSITSGAGELGGHLEVRDGILEDGEWVQFWGQALDDEPKTELNTDRKSVV